MPINIEEKHLVSANCFLLGNGSFHISWAIHLQWVVVLGYKVFEGMLLSYNLLK